MVEGFLQSNPQAALGRTVVVFDWLVLGLFTGSRGMEYAQTVARRGTCSRVPDTPAAGPWRGTPVAFIAADFTFLDEYNRIIPLGMAISHQIRVR